jgi:hypothetical protein
MRIPGARFVAGAFPGAAPDDAAAGADPAVDAASLPPTINDVASVNNTVRPGQRAWSLNGRASGSAMTVAIGLVGDAGYWIVPVGSRDVESPPDLDFAVQVDFAAALAAGEHAVLLAASDAQGRYGPAATQRITVASDLPAGELVVALDWDRDMDLDLLVVQPDGSVLSARGVRTPDGARQASASGAAIDVDSNPLCVIDGRRAENAVYPAPSAGLYEVRVRTTAACGQPSTGWRVRIVRAGTVLAELHGASFASEVDAPGGGTTGLGQRAAVFAVGP